MLMVSYYNTIRYLANTGTIDSDYGTIPKATIPVKAKFTVHHIDGDFGRADCWAWKPWR